MLFGLKPNNSVSYQHFVVSGNFGKKRNARELTLSLQRTNLVVWIRGVSFVKPNVCPSGRGRKIKRLSNQKKRSMSGMLRYV